MVNDRDNNEYADVISKRNLETGNPAEDDELIGILMSYPT